MRGRGNSEFIGAGGPAKKWERRRGGGGGRGNTCPPGYLGFTCVYHPPPQHVICTLVCHSFLHVGLGKYMYGAMGVNTCTLRVYTCTVAQSDHNNLLR